jgi:hypothetical protein
VSRVAAFAIFTLAVFGLCIVVGARAVYYAQLALPHAVAWIPETTMQFALRSYRLSIELTLFALIGMAAVVVSRLVRGRPRFFENGSFAPWLYALGGALCLWHHYLFDADPYMAPICWASLMLLIAWFGWLRARCPTSLALLALVALLVPCFLGAPDAACAMAVVVWGVCLLFVAWLGARRLRPRDAMLVALLLMPFGTIIMPICFAGVIPSPLRPLATVMETQGHAYNYCEFPERHQLFLTVPKCNTGSLDGCDDAFVAEYDTRDFSRRAEHHFFDPSFTGGLRELLCVGDVVQVTMNLARIEDVTYLSNVMEFRADDPSQYRRTIYAPDVLKRHPQDLLGHRYAYDRRRDAVFYVSEWTNTVFRLDRKTNVLNEVAGETLPYKPLRLLENFGLFTSTESIDERRDRLFLSQWGDGSTIFAMDLGSLVATPAFDTHDTGSFATVVDAGHDRLIASGLWGVNVFDMATGALLLRRRLGPGVRDAQIDEAHDLLYLGTTFGGSVWVLDRTTLQTLGRLPVGIGMRRPYITRDGRYLLVTDQHTTYRYETADIAKYFRSTAGDGGPKGAP